MATPSKAKKKSAPARASDIELAMHRRLVSRVRASRRVGDAQSRALRSIARVAQRAGAQSVDAVLTPRGLLLAFQPESEGGPAPFPLSDAMDAAVRKALDVPAVRAQFADRLSLPAPMGEGVARVEAAALTRDWLARVRAMEDECVRDEDVEGVHELRIAIRRCRAALRWLSRCTLDPRVEEVSGLLRTLSAVAGPVRDADVVSALLEKRAPEGTSKTAALAAITEGRHARVDALSKHLRSKVYRDAMKRADDELAAIGASAPSATAVVPSRPDEKASRSLQRCFDRELRRIHERLEGDLTVDEGYHDVRRQLRRVRDIIDVSGEALGARRRAWRTKLQPVQSQLGSFNDAVSAMALVRAAGVPAKETVQWLKSRRASTLTELATPLAVLAVLVISR